MMKSVKYYRALMPAFVVLLLLSGGYLWKCWHTSIHLWLTEMGPNEADASFVFLVPSMSGEPHLHYLDVLGTLNDEPYTNTYCIHLLSSHFAEVDGHATIPGYYNASGKYRCQLAAKNEGWSILLRVMDGN